jgi:hypothetical protein
LVSCGRIKIRAVPFIEHCISFSNSYVQQG